jgi:hypothetical protein
MKEDTMRFLIAVLALVVGVVLGLLLRPRPAPVQQVSGDPLVRVNPDGSVNLPQIQISRQNTVGWASIGGESLQIIFPKSGFPKGIDEPPFAGMTRQGDDFLVRCGSGFCFSGIVNDKLPPPPQKLYYKYDQVVGEKRVDGMIIITP